MQTVTPTTSKLSRLMKMSWDIQRAKAYPRAKALHAAWMILSNEDTTIYYLVQRLNHHKPIRKEVLHQMALFQGTSA